MFKDSDWNNWHSTLGTQAFVLNIRDKFTAHDKKRTEGGVSHQAILTPVTPSNPPHPTSEWFTGEQELTGISRNYKYINIFIK